VEDTLDRVEALGTELLGDASTRWEDLDGVGIAVPGHLDAANGLVRWSSPFGWRDVPLKSLGEARWNKATDVVNDSVAGSMAVQFLSGGEDINNLVFLTVRFLDASHGVLGLGSGVIVNGEPYHGEFGAAGEITTPVPHPLAFARDEAGRPFADLAAFVAAVEAGQKRAVHAMERVAAELAVIAEHAINFLEPGMLVIAADEPFLQEQLVQRVGLILEQHRLAHEAGRTVICGSSLGEFGVVRGAVVPTLQRIFRMPRWQ
jgi:predicted NBD/HSP70 family sugar kinase